MRPPRRVERLDHGHHVLRVYGKSLEAGYFDWQLLPSGRVVVALEDVTGHGIGSALLAAVCRAYARANFTMEGGLLTAMERINAQLVDDMTSSVEFAHAAEFKDRQFDSSMGSSRVTRRPPPGALAAVALPP
jgi:serine phosphatase RsbU (regulator of sigma subunit)